MSKRQKRKFEVYHLHADCSIEHPKPEDVEACEVDTPVVSKVIVSTTALPDGSERAEAQIIFQ